jgi:hypothetical protein
MEDVFLFLITAHNSPSGPVVNEAGVTVGVLVGDGVSLKFSEASHIGVFSICLRISNTSVMSSYPIADFGYATPSGSFIYPLGTLTKQISEASLGALICVFRNSNK